MGEKSAARVLASLERSKRTSLPRFLLCPRNSRRGRGHGSRTGGALWHAGRARIGHARTDSRGARCRPGDCRADTGLLCLARQSLDRASACMAAGRLVARGGRRSRATARALERRHRGADRHAADDDARDRPARRCRRWAPKSARRSRSAPVTSLPGAEAGSKLARARELGIPVLDESGLERLLRGEHDRPATSALTASRMPCEPGAFACA